MAKMPWKTDRYFVSPWNYVPEVTGGLNLPRRVQFHDMTLRDGEQQAGLCFRKGEKVRIAEALAEAGVDRIEAGMPVVSRQDAAAIKEIVRRKLGPKIFSFARCMVPDVKRALDAGVDGIIVEIPCSEHIIKHAYKWPLERAIGLAIEATRFAHDNGLYTVFFPIDASRAEMDWFLKTIVRVATEGHMDALALVDTFGGVSPSAMGYLVRKVKERLSVPIETHFHDDFGCGTANTLLAIAAGCEVAHVTVNGIGERCGSASLQEVALALKTMYGVKTSIRFEKLYALSKLVQKLCGYKLPTNTPIVGERVFEIESGIIVSWLRNCGLEHALELFPYHWTLMGQSGPKVLIGKKSGLDTVRHYLEAIGRAEGVDDDQLMAILTRVKEAALSKKGLLELKEFESIARKVLGPKKQ
ncbi:MAG: pyruvate carboxyltransferase [Planctomycetes bacterium]|nr:pyruvate carboxyltransferase [Planctomycetota bacterium]